jgi:hypothetical protein
VPRARLQENRPSGLPTVEKKTTPGRRGGTARLLPGTAQDVLGFAVRRKRSTPGEKKYGARLEDRSHPPDPVGSPDDLAFGPSVFWTVII